MQITINDYFDTVRGTATPRVTAAVIAEMDKDDSQLRTWLTEVETWANANLTAVKRREWSPLLPEDGDGGTSPLKRNGRRERAVVSPIVEDYLNYRKGKASKDAIARVEAAMDDPDSELSQTLNGVSLSRQPNTENVCEDVS